MKDFISRLTFGFLMAQLFPGAVTVFALTFAYLSFDGKLPDGIVASVNMILKTWENGSPAGKLFLAGLFVAFGMLIHGIHWTILGTLEQEWAIRKLRLKPEPESMFDFPRDRTTLAFQFLIGPFRLFYELFLVSRRRGVVRSAVRENVGCIHGDWMKQHEFMQDFYLYPAQFFAHTSYALVFCTLAMLGFVGRFASGTFTYGLTPRRAFLLLLLYMASSAFFILARVQLATLFRAEQDLIANSANMPLRGWPPALAGRGRRGPPRRRRNDE
jgi:hypothetical protein